VQGDFATAMQHYAKSLVLSQQLGNTRDIAMTLHNMGEAARYQRDYMRAAELYNQSLAIHRKLGDQLNICYSLVALGSLARYQGNDTQAKIFYIEALVICQQQGHLEQTAECVEGLAYTAVRQGQTVRAARLFGAAERLREVSGAPLPPIEYQQYTQAIAQAQTALDPAIYEAVWTDGRRLSLEKAIAYGLSDDES
jgi:tetratricopeptide (TPR) repeat protein